MPLSRRGWPPDDVGRPTKLTHERQERIAAALEEGTSIRAAAEANGIHEATFHERRRQGESEEEGVFSEFAERTRRTRGVGETTLTRDVRAIAREKGDARTLLRLLRLQYFSW
jgi:transposase-like protein